MNALLKKIPLACLALAPYAYAQEEFATEPAPEAVTEEAPVTESMPESAPEAIVEAAPAEEAVVEEFVATEEAAPVTEEAAPVEESAPVESYTETTTTYEETTTTTEEFVTESSETASAPEAARVTDYISLLGTYSWLDDGWIAEEGGGAQLIRGWHWTGNWYVEGQLNYSVFETDTDGATDFYQYGLGVDLVYAFGDRVGFTPFVLAGVGGAYNDVLPDDNDDVNWFGNAGLGFVTGAISDFGFRVRLEGRYIYNDFLDGQHDYRVGLGLELPLMLPAEPMTPATIVEETVQVVDATAAGDADGDGVLDPYDACPDTPQGAEVDGRGCALPQVLTLTGVVFDFNKATLTPDARTILDDVSKKIVAYKSTPMELAGHTDSVGSDEYNLKLSDLRANAVRDYLKEQGVNVDNITAKGYGESEPVADNETDAGRQVNRRVELRIEGQK